MRKVSGLAGRDASGAKAMHERVSVSSLCFMGTSLDEQEHYWRELEPKRISFVSLQVFQEGEDKARAIASGS